MQRVLELPVSGVFDAPVEDVLEAVEAAAAAGTAGAEPTLAALLEEEAETGGLCAIARLAARRYTTDQWRPDG
jgi:hypothetical protein